MARSRKVSVLRGEDALRQLVHDYRSLPPPPVRPQELTVGTPLQDAVAKLSAVSSSPVTVLDVCRWLERGSVTIRVKSQQDALGWMRLRGPCFARWGGIDLRVWNHLRGLLAERRGCQLHELDCWPFVEFANACCELLSAGEPARADGKRTEGPRKAKGKDIEGQMVSTVYKNRDALEWTAVQWASHLQCAQSSVKETKFWKEHRKRLLAVEARNHARKMDRAGLVRADRHNGGLDDGEPED